MRCLWQQWCPSLSLSLSGSTPLAWCRCSQRKQQMGKDKHEPPMGPLNFFPEKARVERRWHYLKEFKWLQDGLLPFIWNVKVWGNDSQNPSSSNRQGWKHLGTVYAWHFALAANHCYGKLCQYIHWLFCSGNLSLKKHFGSGPMLALGSLLFFPTGSYPLWSLNSSHICCVLVKGRQQSSCTVLRRFSAF